MKTKAGCTVGCIVEAAEMGETGIDSAVAGEAVYARSDSTEVAVQHLVSAKSING